jgi:hypothetical protein
VKNNYQGAFVVNGCTFTVNGTANLLNGLASFEIDFLTTSSVLNLAGGGHAQELYLNHSAPVQGQLHITGGTFAMDDPHLHGWANVFVDAGTLSLGAAFNAANTQGFALNLGASLTVAAGGTLNLYDSFSKDLIFGYVDASSGACGKLENFGTVYWTSNPLSHSADTLLAIPVLNHGTFTTDGLNGSQLEFGKAGLANVTDGYAYKQDGGVFKMINGAIDVFDAGYEQTGGDCNIDSYINGNLMYFNSANRIAAFDGGTLTFGGALGTYGTLDLDTRDANQNPSVQFHGVSITEHFNASQSSVCDVIAASNCNVDIDRAAKWKGAQDGSWGTAPESWNFMLFHSVTGAFAAGNVSWPGSSAGWQQLAGLWSFIGNQ